MRKKIIVFLACTMLITSLVFPAAAAENLQLQINGEKAASADLYLADNYSMISVDSFTALAGGTVDWVSDEDFAITENDITVRMTLDKPEALVGDQPLALPAVPTKTGDKVYIPLRAVSNAFGFTVDWDGAQFLVDLTREEKRDGMTAAELLAASNIACMASNTYSMGGIIDTAINVWADGESVPSLPQNISIDISGQFQRDPMQIYVKQIISPLAAEIGAQEMETYMTENNIYVKAMGQDWTVMDMPFSAEFLKEQMDIQSDPLKAVTFMKDMGMLLNFGNDTTVDGKDYYVVNATIDGNKFKEGSQKMLEQITDGLSASTDNQEEMGYVMESMLNNLQMDYKCTVLINKETLISDVISMDATLNTAMDIPADSAQEDSAPQSVTMQIQMNGDIKVSDIGSAFNAPDVSAALEINPDTVAESDTETE